MLLESQMDHQLSMKMAKHFRSFPSFSQAAREVDYLNKIENPDSIQRVIERLLFPLRQRWCDVVDDITNNKHKEITFEDIANFVESKARALNHLEFGTINTECRNQGKTSNDGRPRCSNNFATLGGEPVSEINGNRHDITKAMPKCYLCKEDHWLTHCRQFKKESVEQRLTFMCKRGLCENCFQPCHKVQSCPKNSYCKIPTCGTKHLTFLHPKSPDHNIGNLPSNESPINEGDKRVTGSNNNSAHNAYINGNSQCALTGAGVPTIGLPIVPVKVRARSADPQF